MYEIGFLLALIALIVAWRAHARIRTLEEALARLTAAPPVPEAGQAPEPPEPAAAEAPPRRTGWGPAPQAAASAKEPPPAPAGPGYGERLGGWLRENWIYPAAGAALVLSGVFLVQYAVEAGILTPQARVILALALGGLLVLGGEALRRRPAAGTILPATLAGAGVVIAMAAVLAALHLYAMVGPAAALIALALLAFLAIALGWLHGPFLAALGVVAGTAAPFALGGGGPPPAAIYGYFALLALAGLAIDGLRRWGWVSWIAVILPMGAMVLWRLAGADPAALALAMTLVAAAAMALPFGRIAPLAEGPRALSRGAAHPGTRASFAASAILAGAAAILMPGWEGPQAITALALLVSLWARRAPALADQMALPVLAMPAWIIWQSFAFGPLLVSFLTLRMPETGWPMEPSLIVVLSALAGLALVWRGEVEDPGRYAPWTLAGLLLPFGAVAALETTWNPAQSIGATLWSAHAMALAALATLLALRYGARDAGQGPRLGASAAMAFGLIALAMMLILGQAALTVALAVLMVAGAAMDRRFDIPGLALFLILSGMALLWRLVLDPGLDWHMDKGAPAQVILSVLATVAGPAAALWLIQALPDDPLRRSARLIVETTLVAATAIGSGILLARFLPEAIGAHAVLGLQAMALIVLAWVQVRRMPMPFARRLRLALAWLLSIAAALCLLVGLTLASPLTGGWPFLSPVRGWPVINDLLLAYLAPGLALAYLGGWRSLRAAGWVLVAVWAAMAIRHLWQGPDLSLDRGIAEGELYAYTFALLAAGAVLVGRAVTTGRADLRRLGLALIGVAAAKAFLIDAAGLGGLIRVGAFLALGLSLAGLAWLNGWAQAREGQGQADPKVR